MGKRITHSEEWWELLAPAHVLRCTAHYKDGSPCRREAHLGTTVCGQHGALVPAVRKAAATRIQMTVDEAAARLVGLMRDETVDVRERIKIMQDLLDRGGLNATSKVLVGVAADDPIENLFSRILADPAGLAAPLPPEPTFVPEPGWDHDYQPDDVVEAELVEELPSHTVHVRESISSAPPPYLREKLRELL